MVALFDKLFIVDLVMDAFDNALHLHMHWPEPVSLARWEYVTKTLIEYKELEVGKSGSCLTDARAKRMYSQLPRSLDQCGPTQGRDWLRIFAQHNGHILALREVGQPVAVINIQASL
jgi:hypothetical protein